MATQKGRNWSSGDIVTAANLSSIERGVSTLAEEYTPTTWANGNTVTAAGLNNIEQGIANVSGGGGGSSDFSTAEVTIDVGEGFSGEGIIAVELDTGVDGPINDEYDGYQHGYSALLAIGDTLSQNPPELSSTNTITLLLYSGQCYIGIPISGVTTNRSYVRGMNTSVTGNATLDQENNRIIITGDCTITVNNWILPD